METMETIIVKRASPAARRALGNGKEVGQVKVWNTANQRMTVRDISSDSGERL